jgi:hypothetical protein
LEVIVVVEVMIGVPTIEVRQVILPAPVVVRAVLAHGLKGIGLHIVDATLVACTLQGS